MEEPAWVRRVGNVLAREALSWEGRSKLPRLKWRWGADAPSDAMVPQPFQAEVFRTPWESGSWELGWERSGVSLAEDVGERAT